MVINYGEGVGSFRIKYEFIKLILKRVIVETFLYLVIFQSICVLKCIFGKIRGIFLCLISFELYFIVGQLMPQYVKKNCRTYGPRHLKSTGRHWAF